MIDGMGQIIIYIILAVLIGCFLGWLISKRYLKEKYERRLNKLSIHSDCNNEEIKKLKNTLYEYKKDNKLLKIEKEKVSSGYQGQKYVLDEFNATLDDFQKRLLSKDEVIENLTKKLSLTEERQGKIEKKYEEEIDAFMFERIETTKKYKELLEKYKRLKKHKRMLKNEASWLSKFFFPPSSGVY